MLATIDLASLGAAGTTIYGADAGDQSGSSVSNAGDVNGDGYDDFIVGAAFGDGFNNGRLNTGESYLIFGQLSPPATLNLAALGSAGITLFGVDTGDRFGSSVSAAGDMNGDGFDDLIIGAYVADGANNSISAAGESYVIFGDATLPPTIDLANPSVATMLIYGTNTYDYSSQAVSSAGDVNGDGFDDLIIGAQGGDGLNDSSDNSGTSYLIFGAATLPGVVNLASLGSGGVQMFGIDDNDNSGRSVAGVGDVNGDGFDDVLIGAKNAHAANDAKYWAGESYVVFGRATFPQTINLSGLGSTGVTIYGVDSDDESGRSVGRAGDVNGDGFDDLLIGAWIADGSGNSKASAGESYVVFGGASLPATIDLATLGSAGMTIFGIDVNDFSGESVSAAGDVNGDGYDDVLIGAREADASGNSKLSAGESYLIFGAASLPATLSLSSIGSAGVTFWGVDASDRSGRSVSTAGDVNGDGFDDLLIGANLANAFNNAKSLAGESYLVFGGNSFTSSVTHLGTSANETLTGNGSANIMNGASGNDILVGNGGSDVIYGGQGNDVLAVSDLSFRRLDGGNGSDTLRLDGSGLNLNLTTLAETYLVNIESIDIRGSGANSLTLNLHEVLHVTANSNPSHTANTLTVNRDADDTVNIGSGWTQGFGIALNGLFYDVYTQGTATLYVQNPPAIIDLAALGNLGLTYYGTGFDDWSSGSVSSAGDINADGYDDIIVGTRYSDGEFNNSQLSGESYVIFGSASSSGNPTTFATAGIVIYGGDAGDIAGISVSGAGDFNADGYDDLLVGAISADGLNNATGDCGEAYIIFGGPSLPGVIRLGNLGSAGITIFGASAGDYCGRSVSGAGDVNGDGFDDVLIGAPYADGPNDTRSKAGECYVVFGQASPPTTISLSSLGTSGITIFGAEAFDRTGISVSNAGDANGDGFDDIILGAYEADGPSNGRNFAGDAYLVFGGSALPSTINLFSLGSLGTTFYGVDPFDFMGRSVSTAGDVNGDGYDEIILGAYRSDGLGNAVSYAGESYVVFGRGSWPATIDLRTPGTGFLTIYGADTGDITGSGVSDAGDVNGDGFGDLVIGARFAKGLQNNLQRAGEAYLIFGSPSLPTTINLSESSWSGFRFLPLGEQGYTGESVSTAGDFNGDGFDDFLIGAMRADHDTPATASVGATFIIYGGNFTNSVTHLGTAASESLTGSSATDVINGRSGDDTLVGNGGADIIYGGKGDDVLAISDLTFRLLDGGNGSDALRLDGNGLTLNLTTLPDNRLTNIEVIDIRGSGSNTLILNVQDLLALTANSNPMHLANTLVVRCDEDDTVNIGTGWTQSSSTLVSGVPYQVFKQGAATLFKQGPVTSIDMSSLGQMGVTMFGVDQTDYSGGGVTTVGDLNGDGFDDFLIGATSANGPSNGNTDAGECYVVFGKGSWSSTPTLNLSTLNGVSGFTLFNTMSSNRAGRQVSSAGDVNGDGFNDLLIGVPDATANGHTGAGICYVVFGKADWSFTPSLTLPSLNGTNGFKLLGIGLGDQTGRSVSSAGDVNGDGYDDLLIGAWGDSIDGSKVGVGQSFVVFGKADWSATASTTMSQLNGVNGFTLFGIDTLDLSGFAVSGAGDVNGDGFDDVLIGAYLGDGPGSNETNLGESYVVFGKSDWSTSAQFNLSSLNGNNGFTVYGIDLVDKDGYVLAGAGDVNGDGYDDLLIGAYLGDGSANSKASAGESYVIFGKSDWSVTPTLELESLNGTNGFTLFGADSQDQSGRFLGTVGDFNGDGYNDLLFGVPRGDGVANGKADSGECYLVYGKADWSGTPALDLGLLNGTNGFTLLGVDDNDGAGAVSGAGDVNGDGFADLLIGASAGDGPLNNLNGLGETYLIFGGNFTNSVLQLGTSAADTLTGTAAPEVLVAGCGDDTLIGAGGSDVMYAGQGDDVLAITGATFRRIDGGNGSDTLLFGASGLSLNLTAIPDSRLQKIEIIDIRGSGANTLTLNQRKVLALTTGSNPSHTANTLRIRRDADDTVTMGSGWSRGLDVLQSGVVYQVFTQGTATLLVEELDKTAPTVTITSASSTITNVSPIPVTITFSEDILGFTLADVSVTNATVSNFVAVSGTTFTLDVTPSSQGGVTVNVAAGVATDLALNGNTVATEFARTFDNIRPSLTILPNGTSTNAGQVTFTLQFSEVVTGFEAGEIVVANGSAGTFSVVDGDTYTLVVSTPAEGSVSVSVAANVSADSATNGNTAATSLVTIDFTAPGLSITPDGTHSNASPITFTFQFTEPVTGFTVGDISITNGSAGTLTAVDGDTYTLPVTPSADGPVTVSVASNQVLDAATNGNTAASAAITSDRTKPTLVIAPNGSLSNANSILFTFQFSEAVSGFVEGDISLTNGTGGSFTVIDGDTYTLLVSPVGDGAVDVSVGANAAQDAATNGSLAASASVTSDRTAPTLSITPNGTVTNAALVIFTFEFNEVVSGFTAGDIGVTNGTPGTFTAVDGDTYTLQVVPAGTGLVTVAVGADVAQDAAMNGNTAASASVTSDPNAVTLNITPNGSLTNASPITFTFQFNVTVTGFTGGDVSLTNGTAGTFTAVDGDTYTLLATPGSDGTVTVSVGANAAQDSFTNGNTAASASVTSDRTPPGLSITPAATTTNASPILFTFQFTESVNDFTIGDVAITNGSAGTFTAIDGDTYTLQVTPTSDGTIAVSVAANAAQDAAGNASQGASASVTSDRTAPTLYITPNATTLSVSPITFVFQFSEAVTGFTAGDIAITNGAPGTFTAVDGDSYTLQVVPSSNGLVTVSVGANAAQDAATNGNVAATASVTSDPNAVTLEITPNGVSTNLATILFTFQFNVAVAGFTSGDIVLTNGTAGTFTIVDGDTYTLAVTPIADGTVSVNVAANVAQDILTSGNVAASASVTSDRTLPGLSITPGATTTNASPILFTFQFTEPVTGFAVGDVAITNGTAGTFTPLDGDTYTLQVIPADDGAVSVSVGGNAAQDAVTNGNLATNAMVTSDRTAPTLNITPNAITTNASSILFTFQFSEVVSGFTAGDVSIVNGTAGAFAAVDGDTYTLVVMPTATGTVTVGVGANAAQDVATNGNTAASAAIISDPNAVTLNITPSGSITSASPITFTFEFNVAVTGFTTGDIVITNGTRGAFTAIDGDTYTLLVTPTSDGLVTVDVSANVAQDVIGNGNISATAAVVSDRTPPDLAITPNAILTNAASLTFTFQFTETVFNFTAGDISVTNGAVGTFTAVDGDTYTLVVTPSADGAVSVSVGANAAQDAATNGNPARSASVTSDRTNPGLNITPNSVATNASSILFTFQFTETVTNFTAGDIQLTNGSAGAFTAVDGDTYTLLVTPTANGTVTVNVGATVAQDAAVNGNLAASASVTSDRANPGLNITPNGGGSNASVLTFTFQFTEIVSGFTAGDITVANGTAGTFTAVDGDTYTLLVTPAANGAVTVNVGANAAQDVAANGNSAASATVTSDRTAPTLIITPTGTVTNASSLTFTFQFSEAVTSFNAGDVSLTNGTAGTFTAVDGDTYTLQVTPVADGAVGVSVAANAAQDAVTNGNAAVSASVTSDRTPPGLSITPNATATNAAQITFTFQFTESVTGFVASDISITNGSARTFTAVDGDTYTLVVTPAAGTVAINVAANAGQDAALNGSTAANSSVISDRTNPGLSITPNGGISNAGQLTFTLQFTEPVTGFTAGDIAVTNGTAGLFTAVDADTYTLVVTPTADGAVSVSVGANVALDAATNGNTAATATVTSDLTVPGLSITPNGTLTNAATILFTFQFTEVVSGFVVGDIGLTNGSAGTFTAVDGDTYTLQVIPASSGTVSVSVAANVAQDAASNSNAAASATVTSDRILPTASITTVSPDPRTTSVGSLIITFSEPVTGFGLSDLSLMRDGGENLLTGSQSLTTQDNVTFVLGNTSGLTGAAGNYVWRLNATGSGIQDAAGNLLSVDVVEGWSRVNPTVTLSSNNSSIAEAAGTATITATLSAVTDVPVAVTLAFSGAAAFPADYSRSANQIVIPAGSTTASILLTAVSDGDLETTELIVVDVTGVTNGALMAAQQAAIQILDDDHAPVFTSPAAVSVTENSTAVLTVVATDAEVPAQTVAYSISGGVDQALFAITSAGALTFKLAPNFESPGDAGFNNVYNVQVRANDGHGGLTLQNLAITVTNVDEDAPTVSINSISPDPRNTTVEAITIVFSEAVNGFDLGDLSLVRGSGGNLLTGSQLLETADNITFILSGLTQVTTVDGVYFLTVNAATSGVVDLGGNSLASGASESWQMDATPPTATITEVSPDPRTTGLSELTIVFSSAVSGFDLTDLSLTRDGGPNLLTGSQLLSSADNVTFTLGNLSALTGAAGEYVLSLHAAGSGIQDAVGNLLTGDAVETWNRVNPEFTLSVNKNTVAEAAGTATVTATLSAVTDVNVSVVLAYSGSVTFPGDYSRSGTQIIILAGNLTASINLTATQDGELEGAESIVVDISSVANGAESGTQQVTVEIIDDDHAPVFATSATPSVGENATFITTVHATDVDSPAQTVTYSITGGVDRDLFAVTADGDLSFQSAPNFEAPLDADSNNTYEVQVTANDGHGGTAVQNLTVTVTNVAEGPQLDVVGTEAIWIRKQAAATILPQVTVGGITNLSGGTLLIKVNAIGTPKKLMDVFHFPEVPSWGSDSKPQLSGGQLTLEIQLGPNATTGAIQSYLRGLTFMTKGKGLKMLTRSMQVTLTEQGGASDSMTQTINVRKK